MNPIRVSDETDRKDILTLETMSERPDYLPRIAHQGMSEAYRLKLKIDAVEANCKRADEFHQAALAARTPEDRKRMEECRWAAYDSANFDAMAIQIDAMDAEPRQQLEAAE